MTEDRIGCLTRTTGEISQGGRLEGVSVVKDMASFYRDWKKLSLVTAKVFAAGPAGCVDWTKVLCTVLQPWHILVSARKLRFDWMKL